MINLIGYIYKNPSKQEGNPMRAIKLNKADAILLVESLTRPATVNKKLNTAAIRYESKAQ